MARKGGLVGVGVDGVREMCSGTNFIKTLELNELVNHIAQLGCCPALDWAHRLTPWVLLQYRLPPLSAAP